jgi:Na+/H+ antiporter NhaD/arsenite permease-like protein
MSLVAWSAVAVFVIAYVLIATERVHRVAAALGGAVAMILIGATDAEHAFFSSHTGIDWNVLGLLLGMMLMVQVVQRTGVFEFLAIAAVQRGGGRPYRVMVLLVLVTAVASALLDNVTTVLLMAPVTLSVCRQLGVPVAPYLIAEALASNIGGTATLVGDPPNIIVASRSGLTYVDFLVHVAPLVVVLLVVFLGLARWLFRSAFVHDPDKAAAVRELSAVDAIRDGRLLVVSLVVLTLVTAAFVLHTVLHLEPSVIALIGGLVLLAWSRIDADVVAAEVEWHSLVFFAGLFVMVGALVRTGAIEKLAAAATEATGGRLLLSSMGLLWLSAVFSAIVDNIPYVATMSPVVDGMVEANGGESANVLWWSLVLGADLGGNATAIGASANVVTLGIAERSGHPISFWEFTRYGLVVAVVTIAVAMPYLWLRYFVLAG